MNPSQARTLTAAILELNEAAYQAGQSLNTDQDHVAHLAQHEALGTVNGIIRALTQETTP